MKKIILQLSAYILFGFFSLMAFGILSLVFFISVWIKDANLVKMIVLDLVIILIALTVFVLGLGILEFVLSFIKIEEQVEELEEEAGLKGNVEAQISNVKSNPKS